MDDDLRERLNLARYPRAAGYDPQWMIENVMGPNPLWLLEWAWPAFGIAPGSRVLDLGCGKALTSIFMAREYGVRVTAADLWIKPGENWPRIHAAGCEDVVLPIRAEAHDLPFAEGYFDAVVSVDAYHYFGSDELYLTYLSRFVRPGGVVGIVVPGLQHELDEVPEHLAPYWDPGFWTFHTPAWWARHWSRSGAVTVEAADLLPDGWLDWAVWNEVCAEAGDTEWVRQMGGREAEMVRLDAGRTFAFVRVVGRTAGGSAAPPVA